MAFYILIEKVSESDVEATYSFYDTAFPDEPGELRLDKIDGTIAMTKPTREAFFSRAATKVARCYVNGKMEDRLCWAS